MTALLLFSFHTVSTRCCSKTVMLMTQQWAAASHYFAAVSVLCQRSVPTRHPRLSWIIQARWPWLRCHCSEAPICHTHLDMTHTSATGNKCLVCLVWRLTSTHKHTHMPTHTERECERQVHTFSSAVNKSIMPSLPACLPISSWK